MELIFFDVMAKFVVDDVMVLFFFDGSFDVVWLVEVGFYMFDKVVFVKELLWVVKLGGILVVVDWN